MLRRAALAVVAAIMICFAVGCSSANGAIPGSNSGANPNPKLKVIASVYPMYDFAKKIGGDNADVTLLIKPGTESRDWKPTPAEVGALAEADVFVYNGSGMEPWSSKLISAAGAGNVIACETSYEIAETDDPRVWLDPSLARLQTERIKNVFKIADPAHAQEYEDAFNALSLDFFDLNDAYEQALGKDADIARHELYAARPAFGYLCEAYGLKQISIAGSSTDAEPDPDPESYAAIVESARANGATTVFYNDSDNYISAQAFAEAVGNCVAAPLFTIEALSAEETDSGEDYFSKMRENLSALTEALGGGEFYDNEST